MLRFLLFALTVCVLLGHSSIALAQPSRNYFGGSDYERLGLEEVWSSQVQVDSARSQVSSALLQVVGMDSYDRLRESVYEVYELTFDGRSVHFGENDVDASGHVLGRSEAQRLAEKRKILLEARGLKPELTTREVPPTVLYVQSNTGRLHAIDAETGKTLWAVTVGNPRYPVVAPAVNDRFVATVNGSSLYLLDRASGEPIWDRPLGLNPSAPLAMSAKMVFVPGVNGNIEGYHLPDDEGGHAGTPPWVYSAGGRVTAAPLTTPTTIVWGTSQGRVLVADLDGPEIMYRRQVGGPVHGQVAFLPPDRLVIASADGYVSALTEDRGALQWEFSAGFDLYQKPIALAESTYVVTGQHEAFCISSEDGTEQWTARGVQQILACGQDRIYVRGVGGSLIALDKKTGARIASMPSGAYDKAYSNSLTDRIYLLTSTGTLLCLRETDAYFPTIHRPLPQPAEERSNRAQADSTNSEPEPSSPAGGGGIFGDDMFGGDTGFGDDTEFGDDPSLGNDANDDSDPAASDPPVDEAGGESTDDEEFDDPFDFG